jgi:DNA repair protein RadD
MSSEIIQEPSAPPQWVEVIDVSYKRHHARGKEKPTLWVKYLTEFEEYSEWVCFEHEGYALDKARDWWLNRVRARAMPHTVAEAAAAAPTLPKPTRIKIKQDGEYWRILDYDFKPVERQDTLVEPEREEWSYAG